VALNIWTAQDCDFDKRYIHPLLCKAVHNAAEALGKDTWVNAEQLFHTNEEEIRNAFRAVRYDEGDIEVIRYMADQIDRAKGRGNTQALSLKKPSGKDKLYDSVEDRISGEGNAESVRNAMWKNKVRLLRFVPSKSQLVHLRLLTASQEAVSGPKQLEQQQTRQRGEGETSRTNTTHREEQQAEDPSGISNNQGSEANGRRVSATQPALPAVNTEQQPQQSNVQCRVRSLVLQLAVEDLHLQIPLMSIYAAGNAGSWLSEPKYRKEFPF